MLMGGVTTEQRAKQQTRTRAKGEQERLRLQFECSDNLQSFFRILSLSSHDLFFNELVKANGGHLNVLG